MPVYRKELQKMKKVYTCFTTDVIHEAHINIIKEAAKYGEVYVGVMTDSAMVSFDRFPTIPLEGRIRKIKAIPGVSHVIVQDSVMYDQIIRELRPDYVIHGDNWLSGPTKLIRDNAKSALDSYGGKIIDIPYTYNENIKKIEKKVQAKLMMPEFRRKRLKQLLSIRPIVKAIEVHNGLTGLIAEKTVVDSDGELDQFDAMEVTTKPIIFDGDTGGKIEHFVYTVRTLERMGVSAVIIEDKTGFKKNSLFGTEAEQKQDTIDHFAKKIIAGKNAQLTDDFMIIARIESLILKQGMEDALKRAYAFVEAGADAIMIHSCEKEPDEILEFCDTFRKKDKKTPIVVVPTSYNGITEEELIAHGVNLVIYANQLIRSAFPAMKKTAEDILHYHRAKEVDDRLMPVKEIISLIDEI
mgnify:CR=1 FL=1